MAQVKRERTNSMFVLMPVDVGSLHQRIQRVRKDAGLSQNDLARKAGMTVQNLQKIEQGYTKHLPYETLEAICGALDYPVSKIMKSSEDRTASIA